MLLALLAPVSAWGQTDLSGVYYIGSRGYDAGSLSSNYYLCPTEPWYFYKATNGYAESDNGMPFLTTYKFKEDGTYDGSKAIWILEKHPTKANCYYVIQNKTGRYMVSNGQISGSTNANRMRVHLETVADAAALEALGDLALFEIKDTTVGGASSKLIRPHSAAGRNGSNVFLVVNNNNSNYLKANPDGAKKDGPNGTYGNRTDGVIGLYTWEDNAKFYLEDARCATPTISFNNATGEVTIETATAGATIYYTTDNSIPDTANVGGINPTQQYDPSDKPTISTETIIKAIAVEASHVNSLLASLSITQVATPAVEDNGENSIILTCDTEGATIYYTLDPSEEPATEYTPGTLLREGFSNRTIRMIAKKSGLINSAIGTGSVKLKCDPPIINQEEGKTFTLTATFPLSGVMKYSINDENGTYSTYGGSAVSFSNYGDVVYAKTTHADYYESDVTSLEMVKDLEGEGTAESPYLITSQAEFVLFVSWINNKAAKRSAYYELQTDVSGASAITQPFSGTFDGAGYTITGLTHSLFNTVNGGTVKNVVLADVNISSGTYVGAICDEADGTTKIYNCGVLSATAISGTNTGGLVGHIKSGSSVRVVNCYNFADVSGSDYAAGIVGKNEGTVSSDGTVGNVRIALCMMYGNVTGATNISPVYGGNHVNNVSKFTEYNYWRYQSGLQYTALNDQLPVREDEYLSRFPFYRHILNSHRELAAFFLFGSTSENDVNNISSDEINEIGHWILKKDVADYPIIEPWPKNTHTTPTSTHNNLPSTTDDYAGKLLTNMGTDGYLSVSVIIGENTYSVSLPITDMDTLNYDFTWGKVVLPFANEFEVNSDYTKICTGWKITGITDGTPGTFSNYNVSDRNCTNKDLYSNTGFIFAQGGNYIVPYGVTAIEITANFANAFYLCDASYEIVYSRSGATSGYDGREGRAGTTPNNYHGRTVYNTLNAALGAMSASGTVHEQAVVLVGNYHWDGEAITGGALGKGYTIMSIDDDNNQEPDYALYSNHTVDRPSVPPTRYDFIAMIPLGMSSYLNGCFFYPNIPIWKPRGWFEITETGLTRADQFEIESNNFNTSDGDTKNYRCIINGGYFTQMVRSRFNPCTKLSYYQIGGKAYVKEFYPGNHSQTVHANTLVPVNVTGGEIEQCFMTGYGQGKAYGTDIYFWCAGGRIHKFLSAYMEPPVQTVSHTGENPGTVNLTAKIDHARIYRFFGGGTTSKARITGNINVTINNSLVDFYCGGPEFGDMVTGVNGKTVTTTADHTTFREYYGAGFGGTAITYRNDEDNANIALTKKVNYPSANFSYYTGSTGRLKHVDGYDGLGSCYKFEFLMHSRGHRAVARFYTGFASFSLAKAGSVTNTLTNCTVEGSFYGAGCQGTVDGTVNSTLTNCTILHSAYGGGYKAVSNEVEVYTTTLPSPLSAYYGESGVFSDFGPIPPTDTYEWLQGTPEHNNEADEANKKLYTSTDVTLSDLGNVTGAITLTLNGSTTVNENVFGGGNESKSLSNTTVILKQGTKVHGNVFGGGNNGTVGGNSSVTIQN